MSFLSATTGEAEVHDLLPRRGPPKQLVPLPDLKVKRKAEQSYRRPTGPDLARPCGTNCGAPARTWRQLWTSTWPTGFRFSVTWHLKKKKKKSMPTSPRSHDIPLILIRDESDSKTQGDELIFFFFCELFPCLDFFHSAPPCFDILNQDELSI